MVRQPTVNRSDLYLLEVQVLPVTIHETSCTQEQVILVISPLFRVISQLKSVAIFLIFSTLTAVALPNVNISSPFIIRLVSVVLLYVVALSFSALSDQAIGSDLSMYSGLSLATSVAYIPFHNTNSLSKGIVGLNRMYDTLDSKDPLKLFLDRECKHLLAPLQGMTDIPVTMADPSVLKELSSTIKLESNFAPNQYENLEGKVGIYVFFLQGSAEVTQCGSTVRFTNRMMNHYRDAAKGEFIFKTNAIQDYSWTPVAFGKDYVGLYNSDHVMTPEQETILVAFTEQEIRSLEQSYTTFAVPTNYKNIHIFTSHNNWKAGDVHRQTDAKRITWVAKDGTEYTRASISAGLVELGFSFPYVKKVARSDSPYLNTSKYGLVKVTIDNLSVSDSSQDVRYGTPLNTKVDKTNLLEGKYYLFSVDMQQLPYGPYNTVAEVNVAMGLAPKYSGTYLWVNYLHTVKATGLGMEVYVVKGISTTQIPVIVETLSTGKSVEYKSITSALKVIWPNNRGGYSILKSMVTGKPIVRPDGNSYLLTFKYMEHLAVSIDKYNAHKQTNSEDRINLLPDL